MTRDSSLDILRNDALDNLLDQAELNPRRRQHHNLHGSFDDPCQRFFNAVCEDTYIQPHRHSGEHDEETLIAVRGKFTAVLFDDDGNIDQAFACGNQGSHVGAVIPVGRYHTILPTGGPALLLEIKAGPFDPARAKEFAPWAPADTDLAAVRAYRHALIDACQTNPMGRHDGDTLNLHGQGNRNHG